VATFLPYFFPTIFLYSKESSLEFACVKFSKVKKNTEFIALLVDGEVKNAHLQLFCSDTGQEISMESFYKVAHPDPGDWNAVSLATGRQYFVGKNVEVFVYGE
jgi:hypothetical protein